MTTNSSEKPAGAQSKKNGEDVNISVEDLGNRKFVRNLHENISSDLILVTEDKALICLINNVEKMTQKNAWQVPAGIFATLITVMVTTTPTDKFGIAKETWSSIGVIVSLLTLVWLLRDTLRYFSSANVNPQTIVDNLKSISKGDSSK